MITEIAPAASPSGSACLVTVVTSICVSCSMVSCLSVSPGASCASATAGRAQEQRQTRGAAHAARRGSVRSARESGARRAASTAHDARRAVGGAAAGGAPNLRQRRAERDGQIVELVRLADVRMKAGREAAGPVFVGGIRRQRDRRRHPARRGIETTNPVQHLKSVHVRHREIAEQHVARVELPRADRRRWPRTRS